MSVEYSVTFGFCLTQQKQRETSEPSRHQSILSANLRYMRCVIQNWGSFTVDYWLLEGNDILMIALELQPQLAVRLHKRSTSFFVNHLNSSFNFGNSCFRHLNLWYFDKAYIMLLENELNSWKSDATHVDTVIFAKVPIVRSSLSYCCELSSTLFTCFIHQKFRTELPGIANDWHSNLITYYRLKSVYSLTKNLQRSTVYKWGFCSS